jgi:hypothetical protein
MPCNLAVSITKAQVVPEQMRAFLTPDLIEQIVKSYLAEQYPQLVIKRVWTGYDTTWLDMAYDGGTLSIAYNRTDAEVRVRLAGRGYTSRGDYQFGEQLTEEISELLARAGDALFARQVQSLLMGLGGQMATEHVLVEDAGVQRSATVFTVNL